MILLLTLLGGSNLLHASISVASLGPPTVHQPIVIIGNAEFDSANGVSSGTGRLGDPYIIQAWDINGSLGNAITIVNTSAFFEITGVNVHDAIRGIFLSNATNGLVTNSGFSNNRVGIILQSSPNTIVTKNHGINNGEGILIISSTNANISNNTITLSRGNYGPGQGNSAIFVTHSAGSIVDGNNVSLSVWGIFIDNSPHTQVSRNTTSQNTNDGIHVEDSANLVIDGNNSTRNANGIFSPNSMNALISNNSLSWNLAGVFYDGGNETIANNSFLFNGDGLECGCGTSTVSGNNFVGDGIVFYSFSGTYLNGNTVNGKSVLVYNGCSNTTIDAVPLGQLVLINCINVKISNLLITNTSVGIQMINVNNTIVTHNSVNSNNEAAIIFKSYNVTFTQNNISNNAGYSADGSVAYHNNMIYDNVLAFKGGGAWDSGYPSGGNFWTNYTGVDNCAGAAQDICPSPDGIGDSPFQLGGPVDRYPLMRPYLLSPDTTPPFWLPQSTLTVSNLQPTSLTISWPMAADDLGVDHYLLYQGTTVVASAIASSQLDVRDRTVSGLNPGMTYTFKVEAIDWAGNPSSNGPRLTITMPSAGVGPPQILSEWWLPWVILASLAVIVLPSTILILRRRRLYAALKTVPKQEQ